MSKELVKKEKQDIEISDIEKIIVGGDLSRLSPEQRVRYVQKMCADTGLSLIARPFDFMNLNGKLVLYANKGAAEQIRNVKKVSIIITSREIQEGIYVVSARGRLPDGREDESIGAVPILNLKGEQLSNAMMKAETKAKRRVTLSISGLNMLDETEVDTIPGAKPEPIDYGSEYTKSKTEKEQPKPQITGPTSAGPIAQTNASPSEAKIPEVMPKEEPKKTQEKPAVTQSASPSEYEPKVGRFKGQKLCKVDEQELGKYTAQMIAAMAAQGAPAWTKNPDTIEFVAMAEAFLNRDKKEETRPTTEDDLHKQEMKKLSEEPMPNAPEFKDFKPTTVAEAPKQENSHGDFVFTFGMHTGKAIKSLVIEGEGGLREYLGKLKKAPNESPYKEALEAVGKYIAKNDGSGL